MIEWGDIMATTSIYPTFNLPSLSAPRTSAAQKTYKSSLNFDYDLGDFVRDGANRITTCDGHEAWLQWCLKQLATERYTKLSYSSKIGTELVSAVRDESDPESVRSSIERTITEALLVNPAAEYVREFDFTFEGDSLYITFYVKGKEWDNEDKLQLQL